MIINPAPSITRFDCYTCRDRQPKAADFAASLSQRAQFIVCPTCGNKRCPKATWHENDCTRSNSPGQEGSKF